MRSALLCLAIAATACAAAPSYDVPPFTRYLEVTAPAMSGNDVTIFQNFMLRCLGSKANGLKANGEYDAATGAAAKDFQSAHGLRADGIVGPDTASLALSHCAADHYKDNNATAASLGYLYKVHVPVHYNRSVETTATLFAANGTTLFQFAVRAHGHNAPPTPAAPWPNYNSSGPGLNQFSSDGDTPTGLMEFDLNSPEDEPKYYGPYPVNRAVTGLKGNAAFLVPNIRDGILMHTGEWPNWTPPMVMPNSAGCIHAYPDSIERIWKLLVQEGVTVHANTGGKLPYPYKSQGLLSVECVDC